MRLIPEYTVFSFFLGILLVIVGDQNIFVLWESREFQPFYRDGNPGTLLCLTHHQLCPSRLVSNIVTGVLSILLRNPENSSSIPLSLLTIC